MAKEKSQDYYHKLVKAGQWKKIKKALETDGMQEREWLLEALGKAASESDNYYNSLVQIFQEIKDKPTQLLAIKAMGATKRTAASSQMEYLALSTEDPEIQQAIIDARHAIKEATKS